ncbi:MAG: hypothetical protein WCI27_03700 [Candidatus Omnitrophota bacterium]
MKRLFYIVMLVSIVILSAPASAEECRDLPGNYSPGQTPGETYRKELDLMLEGSFCYDLPIYDDAWRRKGSSVVRSLSNTSAARAFDRPFEVYERGGYAIIYYPNDQNLGPVFLYAKGGGWVIDRTSVMENIHYGNGWMAYGGNYPYLALLQSVYDLKKGTAGGGRIAYQPR